jgi:hypothetical protein
MTSQYRNVGGVLMPFECPPEPDPNWLPNVTPEQEAVARKLFEDDPCGKLTVIFQFQPKAIREKYLRQAGWTGEVQS